MAKKLSTTPIGTAVYPRLETPDTKFDAAGVYSVKLKLSPADGEKLATTVEKAIDAAVEKAKEENPGKKVKRADAPYAIDDETGEYLFNFKLKASGKTKDGEEFTQKPALFDSKGKPFLNSKVSGGSRIRVSFEMGDFWTALIGAGVTLRLRAVQVIEYREYAGRDASGYGFGEEEGFDVPQEVKAKADATAETESEGGAEADF